MSHPQFDALREQLLRAGIAPRHVRRYLGELRQHYADLLSEEKSHGVTGEAAERAARTRLGSNDDLAAAMLARPELRSIGARLPWAVFGVAPLLTLAFLLFAAVLLEIGVLHLYQALAPRAGGYVPGWAKLSMTVWNSAMMYVFPVAIAAAFCFAGARQRIKPLWMALGALMTIVFGALISCSTALSTIPHHSAISVGFGGSSANLPRMCTDIALVAVLLALQWWPRRRPVAE